MNTIKKTLLASCGIAMAMALYACGDDDSEFLSNRDDIESESSSSAGKGTDAKGSSSSVETIVDVQDGPISETDSIDLSEYGQGSAVVDKDGGKVYTLMTSGVDVWTLENLDSKATHPTSACYDYADSLCKGYGRLYLEVVTMRLRSAPTVTRCPVLRTTGCCLNPRMTTSLYMPAVA